MASLAAVTVITLGVVGCAGRPSEDQVRDRVRAELDAAGFDWVQLRVSGRRVRLAGEPPRTGEGGEAVRIAEAVTCTTPTGARACASRVAADFGTTFLDAEVWPRVELAVAGGVLTLRGTVPDFGTRDATLDAATHALGTGAIVRIVDGLHVEDRTPRMGSEALLSRLTRALVLCDEGTAVAYDGAVSVECRLPGPRAPAVRQLLATPLPAGELRELDVSLADVE